jgi:tyrosine-protein kinase Etk/Wzc
MHRRLGELITWASQNYDIVILDTPPILAVTDAAIIGHYVGTTLLVARFEQNTTKEIEVSFKRFEQSGVMVKGCILNGIVKKLVVIMVMAIVMDILILKINKSHKPDR